MTTPDLTNTAKMTHAMCREVNNGCRCAIRKYPQHCESMEAAARGVMAAAGMTPTDVQALLDGKPIKKAPAKRTKKPKPTK